MALYVWYYGKDLMSTWGVKKNPIRSDEDYEESLLEQDSHSTIDILSDYTETGMSDEVQSQINTLMQNHGQTAEEFMISQVDKDREMLEQLLNSNKLARDAYSKKYNDNSINMNNPISTIPDSVFLSFVDDKGMQMSDMNKQFISMGDCR